MLSSSPLRPPPASRSAWSARPSPPLKRQSRDASSFGEVAGAVAVGEKINTGLWSPSRLLFPYRHRRGFDLRKASSPSSRDRIGLELAFGGGSPSTWGQPGDPVALQTPVKRRAGQMREGGLQGIEAVVERQQSMPSEAHRRRPLPLLTGLSIWLLGSGRRSETDLPRLPFGDGLRIDAVALGQSPQALLTMLYRSTDRLCRCGAPM